MAKRTEAALPENEARSRGLIDGSIEGILIHRDHKPLLVNEAWAAIHGHALEEILAMESVIPLISPDERERMIGYRDARLSGEAIPKRYECRALRKDGMEIWLEQLVHLIEWDGAPAIKTIVIDITERKRAEEALEQARDELERRVEERTRELRESEERFRDMAESASDWFWEMGPDLRFTYISERFFEVTGFRPEERIGTPRTHYVDPTDREADAEKWAAHLADLDTHKSFKNFEFSITSSTGRVCHVRISGTPNFDSDGEFLGYRGTGTDITERKRAEAALRESREMLQAVVDAVPAMVNAKDRESRYVFMNRFQAELYGVKPEQAVGQTAGQLMGSEHGAYTRNLDQQVIESGAALPYFVESTAMPRSPSQSWLTTKVPLLDEANRVRNIVTVSLDITELKKAEEELKRSEERLRQATELAGLGHCIWDSVEDRCLFCSEGYARIYGVTREEFIARASTPGGGFIHPDDRDAYRAAIAALKRGEPFEMEYRVVAPDGEIRHVREIAKPIYDETSAVTQEIWTIQDITEAKLAEEKLRQAQKMEAVGQLTAGVAHDFNNRLAVILGSAELLEGELGEDNPHLAAVYRATKGAADLTQRLLAFSRRQMLNPEIINANNLIADITADLLRYTLEEHIDIETVTGAGLWNCEVDPAQLESALVNLAINARDAMPGGGKLTIETANVGLTRDNIDPRDNMRPGEYVLITISDTGSGMSENVKEKIFEPFYTTKDIGKGSGLGLSMVYGFVTQSNGHITVESEEGTGTTFKIYLPRSEASEIEAKTRIAGAVPRAKPGETVLVVEDNTDLRHLLVMMLDRLGYTVHEAGDGNAALDILAQVKHVDLILSDLVLPGGLSGSALAIAARRECSALKVLYMTGYAADTTLQQASGDSGAAILRKPFTMEDLARDVWLLLHG